MFILDITCAQLAPFMRVLGYLLKLVKLAVPIVLIAMVVIDFTKAVVANDEKKMNDSKNTAFKRIIYALVIFLVPTIVSLIFKTVGNDVSNGGLNSPTEWISCFNSFN